MLAEVNRKLEWLRVLFRLAHDRRYLSTAQYENLARNIDEAGRMVGGNGMKRLVRQAATDGTTKHAKHAKGLTSAK